MLASVTAAARNAREFIKITINKGEGETMHKTFYYILVLISVILLALAAVDSLNRGQGAESYPDSIFSFIC